MKKIRRFKCGSCQKEYEPMVEDDIKSIDCECGSKAVRLLVMPKYFGNTTGRSPSAR